MSDPLTHQLSPQSQEEDSTRVTTFQPNSHDWPLQREWLKRAHPDELSWYAHWDWDALAPGLWHWLYRAFIEFDVRQWAALEGGNLLATVSWMPTTRAPNVLWVAAKPNGDATGLRSVLKAACRDLVHYRRLTIEYPAGELAEAFESAGFEAFRTLIWMQAGATS